MSESRNLGTAIRRFQWAAIFIVLVGTQADAGTIISDREALNKLLGASAITEDFEKFNLGQLDAISGGIELDSTTVLHNPPQGPGLVVPGVAFRPIRSGPTNLVIFGPSFFLFPPGSTQTLGTDAVTDTLGIDFIGGVDAVGLDVFGFNANFFAPMPVVLTLFGIDDITVIETDAVIFEPGFTGSKFFGVQSLDAIGSLQVTNPGVPGCCMPVIDNLAFGNTRFVPLPSGWLLVGIGFAGMAIARRVHFRAISPPQARSGSCGSGFSGRRRSFWPLDHRGDREWTRSFVDRTKIPSRHE
jgi:hypothetical protein